MNLQLLPSTICSFCDFGHLQISLGLCGMCITSTVVMFFSNGFLGLCNDEERCEM